MSRHQTRSQTLCACGTPTRDGMVQCDHCFDELGFALAEVPFVVQELEVTLTRQRSPGIGGERTEGGLPFHPRAGQALSSLHALLVSWVLFCRQERIHTADLPADRTIALADWLLAALPALRRHDTADQARAQILHAVADCRGLVFWRKRDQVYLGTCGLPILDDDGEPLVPTETCPGEVYGEEGQPVAKCEECKRGHTMVIRRTEIERRLDDQLCTAADIARYAVILGIPAPRDVVRRRVLYWHRHKTLIQASTTETGDPRFRWRDVRPLLARQFETPIHNQRDTA